MSYFRIITVLAFVALSGLAPLASAQAQGDPPLMSEDDLDRLQYDAEIIESVPQELSDEYLPPTVQNLSKLYWAIGKLDTDEPKLIDNYLMINECDLYLKFYHNDFEWQKIQAATREYILGNMDKFPTQFEIISQIGLGRYDIDKEEFDVLDSDKLVGMRRIDFEMNDKGYRETCTDTSEMYEYPENIIIILSRPFTLEKVPVERELAKLYIEEAKKFYEMLPSNLQMRNYERMAFLRLKVRITQYKNTVRVLNGALRAVVFGVLDGYEIYADADKMKPLYLKDMRDQRFKRLRGGQKPAASIEEPADGAGQEITAPAVTAEDVLNASQ